MEFDEILVRRRMVRRYRSDPIPADLLRRILDVVRRAPSAGNCRPHRLALVTDPAARARLAAIAEDWYLRIGLPPWISQAPAQIVLHRHADAILAVVCVVNSCGVTIRCGAEKGSAETRAFLAT